MNKKGRDKENYKSISKEKQMADRKIKKIYTNTEYLMKTEKG